jgi:hypothetical protein
VDAKQCPTKSKNIHVEQPEQKNIILLSNLTSQLVCGDKPLEGLVLEFDTLGDGGHGEDKGDKDGELHGRVLDFDGD